MTILRQLYACIALARFIILVFVGVSVLSVALLTSPLKASIPGLSASSLPPGKVKPSFCDALKSKHFKKCFQYHHERRYTPLGIPYEVVEYHLPKYLLESLPHSDGSPSFFKDRGVATFDLDKHNGKSRKGGMQTGDLGVYNFKSRVMSIPAGSSSMLLSCSYEHLEAMVPMIKAGPEQIERHWTRGDGDTAYQEILRKVAKPFIEDPSLCLGGSLAKAALHQVEAETELNVKKYADTARDSLEFYNKALTQVGKFFPPFNVPETLQKNLFLLSPIPPYMLPCSGWGFNYPRSGSYYGSSELVGSVSSAMKMRNLGTTVFKTIPVQSDEKIQMVYPRESGCFTEGKPIKVLEENIHTRLLDLAPGRLRQKFIGAVISNDRSNMPRAKTGQQYILWHKVKCKTHIASPYLDKMLTSGPLEGICKAMEKAEEAAINALGASN